MNTGEYQQGMGVTPDIQQNFFMSPLVVRSSEDVYENNIKHSLAKNELPEGLVQYVKGVIGREDSVSLYTDKQIAEDSVYYGFSGLTRKDISRVRHRLEITASSQRD